MANLNHSRQRAGALHRQGPEGRPPKRQPSPEGLGQQTVVIPSAVGAALYQLTTYIRDQREHHDKILTMCSGRKSAAPTAPYQSDTQPFRAGLTFGTDRAHG
jgi:hypothetical protein